MSRDPDPPVVLELLPVLRRIAVALELSYKAQLKNAHVWAECSNCFCMLVTGNTGSRVECPACGTPTEVH